MTTVGFLGWGCDLDPYGQLFEGQTSGQFSLQDPDQDDAETIPALIAGTADGHLVAMESHLYRFMGVNFETPLFADADGDPVARAYDLSALVGSGSTTTNIVLQSSYQPHDGGDGLDGVPIAVIYKNSSTDTGDWTWEIRVATGQTWNSDHWEITTAAFSTAPSSGDIVLIGPCAWHYELWENFQRGSVSPLGIRLFLSQGIPDSLTSLMQIAEYPSEASRAKTTTAAKVIGITSTNHAARSRIPLRNDRAPSMRLVLRGINVNQFQTCQWVDLEYNIFEER